MLQHKHGLQQAAPHPPPPCPGGGRYSRHHRSHPPALSQAAIARTSPSQCTEPALTIKDAAPMPCQRRAALLALLRAAMLLPWTASAAPAIAAAAAAAPAAPAPAAAPERNPAFYAAHPYATPADILPFIQQQAAPGDAQAVLDAMDTFSQYYPQYKIGPEKGALLEGLLLDGPAPPTRVLEVGTFLGYSAIRIARHLGRQPGARLVCIEANTQNAAVAREVLRHAGVADRVLVLDGLSSQVIPQLPQLLLLQDELQGQGQQAQQQRQQPPQQQGFDVVFLDHCKECYLPDLQLLERLQLVRPGTRVVADNVVYPGAPGFLEYLDSSGHYVTRLLDAAYEYEQPWNPSWEAHKRDALSVSLCQAGPQAAAAAAAGDAVLQLGT